MYMYVHTNACIEISSNDELIAGVGVTISAQLIRYAILGAQT